MARRKRRKESGFPTEKRYDGSDYDGRYQYMHLGHLETTYQGKEIEQGLIDNGVLAEKSITISGCWTFRWKRDAYDMGMLKGIFMVFDYPGMKYIQKPWHPIGVVEQKAPEKRRRRRKRA